MVTKHQEPVVAIVVAAGSGIRMGEGVPKALRLLNGLALVTRSVSALANGGVDQAVIVVADGLQTSFQEALADSPIPISITTGGSERQDSVRNGLVQAAKLGANVVLIHDAARALVPPDCVSRVIAAVRQGAKSVIPVLPVIDSIREVLDSGSAIVDRSRLVQIQTPQGFDLETVVAAHDHVAQNGISVTDDASACEALGVEVVFVPGDRMAMKVTEPIDMVIAEALAAQFGV